MTHSRSVLYGIKDRREPRRLNLRAARRAITALAVFWTLGCPSSQTAPLIRIGVSPTPPTVGTARIIVTLTDTVGPAVSARVSGRRLPDGDATVVEARPGGPGRFASEFPFAQVGTWRLVAEATLGNGGVLRDSADVRVVAVP